MIVPYGLHVVILTYVDVAMWSRIMTRLGVSAIGPRGIIYHSTNILHYSEISQQAGLSKGLEKD